MNLNASWSTIISLWFANSSQNGSYLEPSKLFNFILILKQNLHNTGSVSNSYKVQSAKQALFMQPALDGNRFINMVWEVFYKCTHGMIVAYIEAKNQIT